MEREMPIPAGDDKLAKCRARQKAGAGIAVEPPIPAVGSLVS